MNDCAACRKVIKRGETLWESTLYGSFHILCEPCGLDEEALIENAGTNDLPEILKMYGPENDR